MKKYKWHPMVLVKNLMELASILIWLQMFASYVEVVATHHASWWNFFSIFLK